MSEGHGRRPRSQGSKSHPSVLEVKVKKAQLSPGTSLLVSLSLVLGIIVSDLCGYQFLNAARAGSKGQEKSVKINEGVALNSLTVHGLLIDGQVVARGVIAGDVRIVDSTVSAAGVVVGDTVSTSGVVVGDTVSTAGVVVGDTVSVAGVVVGDTVSVTGVVVGDTVSTSGVVVGDQDQDPSLSGGASGLSGVVIVGGRSSGGMLTGDDITVSNGVITGQNLVLTGANIKGGAVYAEGGPVVLSSSAN